MNSDYKRKSGGKNRCKNWNEIDKIRLDITVAYFENVIDVMNEVIVEIRTEISTKFEKKTRITAAKIFWAYLFQSEIIKFDDWIEVDSQKDKIVGWKKDNKWYVHISGGEKMLIDFVSENFFYGMYPPNKPENWTKSQIDFKLLDNENLERLKYLVTNAGEINRLLKITVPISW